MRRVLDVGLIVDVGVHDDVPAAQYHADPCKSPSLSSSIAKVLLDRTPRHAWHAHPRLNPNWEPEENSKFDLGTVAHAIILGRGAKYEIIDAQDWRTKAAQSARDEARANGKTPILRSQFDSAGIMADEALDHLAHVKEARLMFAEGAAERVLIWRDGDAMCRCMIDWHGPTPTDVWDIKTTDVSLSDNALARLIVNLGYDLSAAFYLRGLTALFPELAGRFKWRWIFCETSEPFEVRVIEPSAEMLAMGDRKAALAIAKWSRCIKDNNWPGYAPAITRLEAPSWATDRQLEREMIDEDADHMRPLASSPRIPTFLED